MPKLDISVDKELHGIWKKHLSEKPEINQSGLVRKLIKKYLEEEGIIKKR